jgi:flagellar basal-body rod protein FlgC
MGDTSNFYNSIQVSASGLSAERLAMDVIANNIANANTTRTPEGGPFKRQLVIFSQKIDEQSPQSGDALEAFATGDEQDRSGQAGVEAVGIVDDPSADRLVYDPTHPDADAQGYVHYPNVQPVKEMVDLMAASRAYEANVSAIQQATTIGNATLNILKA